MNVAPKEMLTAWEACLCKWARQRRGAVLQQGKCRRNGRNSHPQNTHLEKPPMQVENSSLLERQTLGLSTVDYSLSSSFGWLLSASCQEPCGQGWSSHPPWAAFFLLLPFAVLLSRLCPAPHHPQGAGLGVPHLDRVSPWFASLQHWPRAPKKPQV